MPQSPKKLWTPSASFWTAFLSADRAYAAVKRAIRMMDAAQPHLVVQEERLFIAARSQQMRSAFKALSPESRTLLAAFDTDLDADDDTLRAELARIVKRNQ
jgi:hypothetical protein